ncbi:MAG TPA: PHP domain-containing protein [Geobacterales bacterium]|nr:PHP domain-containing protein [Geobacterales bacterium]
MLISFDYHIHSCYSYDSLNRPEDILRVELKKGVKSLSITDHNTIKGSLIAKKLAKKYDIIVVTGIELYTNMGDLIILGCEEEIKNKDFFEVLDIANSSDWVTILPHPYVRHVIDTDFLKAIKGKVTAIEIFNSRASFATNTKAYKLAKALNKPGTAGSDAHLLKELGNGLNFVYIEKFDEDSLMKSLKKGLIKIRPKYSNPLYHVASAIIQIPKRFAMHI